VSNITLSDGNLTADWTSGTGSNQHARSTFAMLSGKWYFETRMNSLSGGDLGVAFENHINDSVGFGADQLGFSYRSDGQKQNSSSSGFGASFGTGDILACAYDADAGSIQFYKNGVSQGTAFTGISIDQSAYFAVGKASSGATMDASVNFGQNPTFSGALTAGTNADDSGKGLFKYAPPSGFLALCEDNLPTPAIADPGKYFKSVLYEGSNVSNGVGRSPVRGVGFKPDFVWIKCRDQSQNHILYDSVRGLQPLNSNNVNVESTFDSQILGGYDEDGFTTSPNNDSNYNGQSFVAWCWKAGGAAVSNADGTLASQVSVNQDAGFSIVSYTGTGANATVGHGLGKTPSMIIVKKRSDSVESNWTVYHKSLGNTKRLFLNLTNGESTNSATWNDTTPTSSVFSLGGSTYINDDTETHIAYCWSEIEGYSKFGSYVGNSSNDGTFVYCGFKPAWVMIKVITTGTTNSWYMHDSSRNSTNPSLEYLTANNSTGGTVATSPLDMLSNGFKLRNGSYDGYNGAYTYIFAAFAESPFQTANAK
jgi:hypothetical protein